MLRPNQAPRPDTRGVVIVWVALFLMVMLGFIALGIDVAKLMATRTQLQNAADAAALAGASALDLSTGVVDQDTALVRAQALAAANSAFLDRMESVTLAAGDVSFPARNQVRVTVRRSAGSGGAMVTHVAQVLGIRNLEVRATAVAQAETAGTVCERLVPLGAIEPLTGDFQTGCSHTYELKIGSNGGGTPGNFQFVDFPPCSEEGPCQGINGGAAEIRCEVANGYGCCIQIGQWIQTMPGNKVGPFRQGLQDRWGRDTDQREDICYEDYRGNGQRIVLVPMFRDWDPNGKKAVKVEGFSAFFLQRMPGSGGSQTLWGQFLYQVAPGGPGPPGSVGTTLFALRLVK
jgi:Flp pilus assembly protein TadG